jgi:hypothetical protein
MFKRTIVAAFPVDLGCGSSREGWVAMLIE